MSCKVLLSAVAALMLLIPTAAATGQQPTNAASATMPAKGLLATRTIARFDRFDESISAGGIAEGSIDRLRIEQELMYGLAPDIALLASVPVEHRVVETDGAETLDDTGVGDARLGVKYRFLRHDSSPLDTFRAAATISVRVPTGSDAFSVDAPAFSIDINTTTIRGRHGFNTSARYEITTGASELQLEPGDALSDHAALSFAHLYRLDPREYDASTRASAYTQLELLGHAQTNGDAGLDLAPGVLIEGRRWAAEASVIIPLFDDLSERPERQIGVVLGVRLLF